MSGNRNNVRHDLVDPRIDRIINCLSSEIADIESKRKKPGWTIWALYGATAYLIWILLSIIERQSLNWSYILSIFLFLSIACDIIFLIYNTISTSWRANLYTKRFEASKGVFYEFRSFAFSLLIRAVMLLILMCSLNLILPKAIAVTIYIYLIINVTFSFFFFVMSFLNLPFPKSPKTKYQVLYQLIYFIWIGIGTVASTGLIYNIFQQHPTPSVADWRAALVLFGLSLLILLFTKTQKDPFLLYELKEIKKRICLEQIDYDTAIRQIDLVLYGLTLGEVLEPIIKNVLHSHNSVLSEFNKFMSDLNVLKDIIGDGSKQLTDHERTTVDALLLSLDKKSDDIRNAFEQSLQHEKILSRRVNFIKYTSPNCAEDIKIFLDDIKNSGKKIELAGKASKKEIEHIRQTIRWDKHQRV